VIKNKKLKLLLSKEEGKISKIGIGLVSSAFLLNSINAIQDLFIKSAHQHNIISEAQSCSISTEAGFDYGGKDWSDINWFDNVALKCNLAKIWHNVVSYGCCCGYTFTWNDITQ